MLDWREAQLAELIEIKHGFAFKGEFFSDNPSDDILVTPGNFAIGGGFQLNKPKFYTGPVPEDYVLSAGDVIVTMTDLSKAADTLGYSAIVPTSKTRFLHNQRIGKVTPKSEEVFLPFIAWVMRTLPYRNEIVGAATGSTVKHSSPSRILSHKFKLPLPLEQRAIASVLGALEDKIELNRRMNETLEATARAIFKDWFVDFGPTRAKMEGRAPYLAPDVWSLFPDRLDDGGKPDGWKPRPVGDFAELRGGKQLGKERISTIGTIPVFGGAGVMGFTDEHNADGFVISVGRVGAYCGQFFSHRGKSWINNNASLIRPFERISSEWLFQSLRHADIEVIKKGAAQPFVSNTDVANMPIIWPGENVVRRFTGIVVPLMLTMEQNNAEASTLSTTRDFILPKLMSGEVRVKDAEKLVGEAT